MKPYYFDRQATLYQGDVRDVLREFPEVPTAEHGVRLMTTLEPNVFQREQALRDELERLRRLLRDVRQDLDDGATGTAVERLKEWEKQG